jgi:hypothetical protein
MTTIGAPRAMLLNRLAFAVMKVMSSSPAISDGTAC